MKTTALGSLVAITVTLACATENSSDFGALMKPTTIDSPGGSSAAPEGAGGAIPDVVAPEGNGGATSGATNAGTTSNAGSTSTAPGSAPASTAPATFTDAAAPIVIPPGQPIDGATSGLPCEVATLLVAHCTMCHSSTPVAGTIGTLLARSDFPKPTVSDPKQTVAEMSIARMKDGTMPPAPMDPVTAPEIAAFESWVNAGMPPGTCADAGTAPPNPYGTPLHCTSGKTTTAKESSTMDPGQPCIACHAKSGEAPKFAIAGTVYPSAHEPDNCNGLGGGAAGTPQVVITDANGKVTTISVGSTGNFQYEGTIALPYKAKVTAGGKERPMVAAQKSGDCNSCHMATDTSQAPARVMAP